MRLYRGMTITGDMLRQAGACLEQSARVDELWPDGAALTLDNLRRAMHEGLSVVWLVDLLPPTARAVYNEAMAPAWAAYEEAMAPAWAAYEEAMATAWAAYEEAMATALWDALPEAKP